MIHLDALRKLDPKDQNELKKISQLIIKKLIISGKEVGLNRNQKEAAIRFEVFDEFHKEKNVLLNLINCKNSLSSKTFMA